MNPALLILIVLGLIILWFLLSGAFIPLGKLFFRFWKDATDAMNEVQNEEDK